MMLKDPQFTLLNFTPNLHADHAVGVQDMTVFHSVDGVQDPNAATAPMLQGSEARSRTEYDRGVADGQAKSDELQQSTISLLQNVIDELQSGIGQLRGEIEQSHWRVVHSCLEAILPDIVDRKNIEVLSDLILESVRGTFGTEPILTLHPDNQEVLELSQKHMGQNLCVESSDAMGLREISLSWEAGELSIDIHKVAQDCLRVLNPDLWAEGSMPSVATDPQIKDDF